MPKTLLLLLTSLLAFNVSATGSHAVNGYVKKNGTVVAPYHATNANSNKSDNYSSKGNLNPYTDKKGSKK